MDIIKTKRTKGYDITLIYFEDTKGYEIQISRKPYEEITDFDGLYSTKKAGLRVFNIIVKEIETGYYDLTQKEKDVVDKILKRCRK